MCVSEVETTYGTSCTRMKSFHKSKMKRYWKCIRASPDPSRFPDPNHILRMYIHTYIRRADPEPIGRKRSKSQKSKSFVELHVKRVQPCDCGVQYPYPNGALWRRKSSAAVAAAISLSASVLNGVVVVVIAAVWSSSSSSSLTLMFFPTPMAQPLYLQVTPSQLDSASQRAHEIPGKLRKRVHNAIALC